MFAESWPVVLLASNDTVLLNAFEPAFAGSGLEIRTARSGKAALSALLASRLPDLVLLDAALPGMPIEQLVTAAREASGTYRHPIVLLADNVPDVWTARLHEGVIDDVIPRSANDPHWHIRVHTVLRGYHRMREVERLQAETARNAQIDPLTRTYNRSALLSMLFRETDRVQRMKTPLCLLLMDIDDFGHWNERLGTEVCDELLRQIVDRSQRLLRSYDVLGRAGMDEFLTILPGCTSMAAVQLAERLRAEVFAAPFHAAGNAVRLSACFGISTSDGRSPVVVLREAELSLQFAKKTGPESIQYFSGNAHHGSPVTFLSASSGEKLLAW